MPRSDAAIWLTVWISAQLMALTHGLCGVSPLQLAKMPGTLGSSTLLSGGVCIASGNRAGLTAGGGLSRRAALACVRGGNAQGVLGLQASVRIASYNVLSSELCEPAYYVNSDPDALEPAQRLKRVITKLERECDQGAIVCLQEVSRTWSGELHTFFARRGYHMINVGYGGKKNGFMGVSLAFDASSYELQEAIVEKVSDYKEWPRAPTPRRLVRIMNYFKELVRKLRRQRLPLNEWADAEKRHNCLAWVRLKQRSTGKTFGVATYHMPCQFRIPSVMVIHTALVAQRLHELARDDPLIWCGDFNFKPGDAPYRLITEGNLPSTDEAYPTARAYDAWTPTSPISLLSAYKQIQGEEPAYTNWAHTRNAQPFVGTLDYIFVSPGCQTVDVLPMPKELPANLDKGNGEGIHGGPFPSIDEPSDHLMVAATIELP